MAPSETDLTENQRTVRVLLAVEATSFFLAALVHAGLLTQGFEHHEAMIAEGTIGIVLLLGLAITWIQPRSMFSFAVAVQAFALLGTFVGIFTIAVGIGPRTVPDIVYHVAIAIVLTSGLVLAVRSRAVESTSQGE
ncbi:hypothetical protein [Haladaptatus caseinilyticus]|uniref:hypothetical protein n=1 Tax=Haladaptatus caseinilyticus TaxID=2993314 RepID=UPI00224B6285|nr:hypothetical protein [Haladaptatus caseinilyticus]